MTDYYSAPPEAVALGVIEYWTSQREEHFDAAEAFLAAEESEPERAWEIALAVARFSDHDDHLGQLGAGVLATLLRKEPRWMLGEIERAIRHNSRMAQALTSVRLDRDDEAFNDFVQLMRRHSLPVSRYIETLLPG